MSRRLKSFIALMILGLVALAAIILIPAKKTIPQQQVDENYQADLATGKYLAVIGNCLSCHTSDPSKPFAGGRAIDTDMGTIYSTNITPDEEHGIGKYSLDEFRAALYDGLRNDGKHLYPAMPYENYRKLSEEDIRAMYAYFQEEVEAINAPNLEPEMKFPFNQRWGIRLWKWINLEKPGFTPPTSDNQLLVRGAYLVQAVGHCGACHSPRNTTMGQKGIDERSQSFLTGAEMGGFTVPALHGKHSAIAKWSVEDLGLFLSTGRNKHATATGSMAVTIEDALQFQSEDDTLAMSIYLKHLNQDHPSTTALEVKGNEKTATELELSKADPKLDLGKRLYLDNCVGCHFVDGKGAPEIFPKLDGNSIVIADNPTSLINILLHGAELPSTELRPARLRMPDFAWRLDDEEVAELATFIRKGWNNKASAVSASQVEKIRAMRVEK
ncbi:cytochrome c [Oligella urethralis]|uniref:G3-ADH subunit II n=1 Tax=Oligella urethralis TaxID=90245 RepID=A0A2X1ULE8_9BURK|nr:cytochrome c [Oligella urethralis]SPY07969.1 G3-ADH subunit II [Oligella urethralis]SUA54565.1 G3-ADH subunit II [Oligella urethralis]SUA68238.1 G3-ADH subunit II [Oligella urethralis]